MEEREGNRGGVERERIEERGRNTRKDNRREELEENRREGRRVTTR